MSHSPEKRMSALQGLESSDASGPFESIGQSPAFLDFQDKLRRVAPVDRPVLLIGERGAGKELAAKRLHYLSKRWERPFVTLHCAALSPTLIESELFGHEQGAFTGAGRRRIGRFEAADTGTLFLDELSLIPLQTQEKILRVVEYGSFERVGGGESIQVNVRIIGATNVDLSRAAGRGRFKRDLLDRLSFEVLFLPPLRERVEDIMLLSRLFAGRIAFELNREEIPVFTKQAIQALESYAWPGNIRELKNVVERAIYRSESSEISEVEFDPFRSPYKSLPLTDKESVDGTDDAESAAGEGAASPSPESVSPAMGPAIGEFGEISLCEAVRNLEIQFIWRALMTSKFNKKAAAQELGLTYDQFRGIYRKHSEALTALEDTLQTGELVRIRSQDTPNEATDREP